MYIDGLFTEICVRNCEYIRTLASMGVNLTSSMQSEYQGMYVMQVTACCWRFHFLYANPCQRAEDMALNPVFKKVTTL